MREVHEIPVSLNKQCDLTLRKETVWLWMVSSSRILMIEKMTMTKSRTFHGSRRYVNLPMVKPIVMILSAASMMNPIVMINDISSIDWKQTG